MNLKLSLVTILFCGWMLGAPPAFSADLHKYRVYPTEFVFDPIASTTDHNDGASKVNDITLPYIILTQHPVLQI